MRFGGEGRRIKKNHTKVRQSESLICIIWYIFNCSFLSLSWGVASICIAQLYVYFVSMLVWVFGFLGQELAPKFRLNLLSTFCNFSPLDPFDLIRKKKKKNNISVWLLSDPLTGPAATHISADFEDRPTSSSTNLMKRLAEAGLNFYLQLIRREHFDISHLTPSLSVCSSNPFSGKSDSVAHSGAKMLEHFVSNVITSNSECNGETVQVRRHRAGGFLFRNNPMTCISAPQVKRGAQMSPEEVSK